jgi:phospholipid/cholesterol/gamma-HCH transport system substrate-binding protein
MNLTRKSIALLSAGLLAAGLLGHHALSTDADGPIKVDAVFADASPLVAGNVVKASGVEVGKITAVKLRDGQAHVQMVVDRSVLPLHDDVKATITTQDLLGERFVRLERGSPSAPVLKEPMVIDTAHTHRVVDLQDVLNSVDTPTSTALAALVTESGEGLKGRGQQADKALAALAPAMTQTKDLAAILSEQNTLLTHLVDNAQPVASALGSHQGRDLDHIVDSANTALTAVAANRESLRASLRQLPQTIASARATLAQLSGVADPATRTLASLRPVTDDLDDISGELQRFADAADPALASLPPVLDRANVLLGEAAPVVAALRPAAKDLVPTAASVQRLSSGALSGKNLTNLMEFVKGWSMATSDYDSISHYFKAMVPLSPNSMGDTAAGVVPALPDDLIHGLPVPTAPQLPQKGRRNSSPAGSASANDSATGLSEHQENSLVDQLLGGSS